VARRQRGSGAPGAGARRSWVPAGPPPGQHITGVGRVLVDGRNVQGALRRGRTGDPLPETAFVSRLRAALAGLEVLLVLDGHAGGGPQGRIAPGFRVEYGRHRDADSVIGDLVVDGARELGPAGVDAILVVTDDRAVQDHARRHGARVAGTAWLLDRVDRAGRAPATGGGSGGGSGGQAAARPGTSIGHGRAPRAPRPPSASRPPRAR
jgi:hypothetical protein